MAPTTIAVACTPAELKDGQMKEVEFGEGKVLLSRVGGQLYATSSKCTHYGAPLVKGVLAGDGRVVCPWHGACFNVTSGDIEDAPGLDALHKFSVEPTQGEDDPIRITADLSIVTSKKGRLPCADRARAKKHTRAGEAKEERVIIIGGGSAGAGAIEGLRELGFGGRITLLTSEPHPPIDRTKLSKALITDAGKITLRSAEDYASDPFNIDLRLSTAVEGVDLAAKTVRLADGGVESWDKLIVATGASPRSLPVDGKDLAGIHKLRTIEHAKAIDAELQEGKKLVLVGSSFISMELAVLATNRKLSSLTVVGMESVPFERVLGKEVGAGLQKSLEAKGMEFFMQASVDCFVPAKDDKTRVGGVKLKDGTVLDADLVVLGVGAAPNAQLLEQAGVELVKEDRSVRVNSFLQIDGHPDVYAVGDIATYPVGDESTRIEHWGQAGNLGRAAAAHIAVGEEVSTPFDKTPIFWSALGSQLRYAGSGKGFDEVFVDGQPADMAFAAYYAKGGAVIASASMGRDPLNSQVAELLRLGKMPTLNEIKAGKSPLDVDLSIASA